MPQIIRAEHMGFCFGVRDALTAAQNIAEPAGMVVYGELVHNAQVSDSLRNRGMSILTERNRDTGPRDSRVLITAHGISDDRRRKLIDSGNQLVDTTCPLVRRVHDVARSLVNRDFFIVVIGLQNHVEVQGIVEDLPERGYAIVSDSKQVSSYDKERIGIICQTTMPEETALACRDQISLLNPTAQVRWINTICRPTKQRQTAVDHLCSQVQCVVIVGGTNSNNTRRLTQRCRENGCVAHQIEKHQDLLPEWFDGVDKIGLTAGTSTPDEVIDAVEARMLEITRTSTKPPRLKEPARSPCNAACNPDRWQALPSNTSEWLGYFQANQTNNLDVEWDTAPSLSTQENHAVIRSIQTFQLGERGEGKHILGCASDWISKSKGDPCYLEALKLFLKEENRHADWLGRFLAQENAKLLQQQWSDNCFRSLRHRAGLYTSISVLVTAEILAQVYYLALSRATKSPTLIQICRRILRDERFHVAFQQQQKNILKAQWSTSRRNTARILERSLYALAMRVLWHDHKSVFRLAEFTWPQYKSRCLKRWHVGLRAGTGQLPAHH